MFVTYSANFEDVILNRLFGTSDHGFYVDVGAAHPVFENDTKALYDRGWRGINVEPNISFFRELVAQRPDDCNLNVAVSDNPGQIAYFEVVGTGLSTCDPEGADRAAKRGFEVVRHTVEAVSLRHILEEAAPYTIDVFKVDVEGFELRALSSNDWARFRPKVILVEATFPETPIRRPDVVTPYLMGEGYRLAYFDGLNNFYVERDFEPAPEAFDRPPNVFDRFVPNALQELVGKQEHARAYAVSLEQERESERTRHAILREELTECSRAVTVLEKQLRRAAQAAVATVDDLANARAELISMRTSNRDFAAHLEASEDERRRLDHELQRLQNQIEQIRAEGELLQREVQQLRLEREMIVASRSWRITRPLRAAARPKHTLRTLLNRLLL